MSVELVQRVLTVTSHTLTFTAGQTGSDFQTSRIYTFQRLWSGDDWILLSGFVGELFNLFSSRPNKGRRVLPVYNTRRHVYPKGSLERPTPGEGLQGDTSWRPERLAGSWKVK